MAFKGTRRRNAREIAEAIENVGGDLNAETGVEQTAYFARVLGEDVDLALDVLADILTDSRFDPDELGAREERHHAGDRRRRGHARRSRLRSLHRRGLAATSRSAGRSSARARASARFDRAAIDAYLRRHYRAGATIVAAAGAVDHDRIVARAEALLGALGRRERRAAAARRAYRGGEILVKKRLEQTHIVVGFEGRAISAADHDAAHVFAAAAGGGMSSRLFQEVREKRGLAYSIYAFHWAYSDSGLFGFYAGAAAKDAGELMAAALDCLGRGRRSASTRTRVGRAKAQLKVSTLTALELPERARAAAGAPDVRLRPRRCRSKTCWRASTRSPSTTFAKRARPCLDRRRPSRRSAASARRSTRPASRERLKAG